MDRDKYPREIGMMPIYTEEAGKISLTGGVFSNGEMGKFEFYRLERMTREEVGELLLKLRPDLNKK